mmetsp:Transcript_46184/g.110102  ORF Transcript_46184/g.110102 Transcript_46184/m.110102 type:complete len:202 (-) Transcript_46184:670-1275(-)
MPQQGRARGWPRAGRGRLSPARGFAAPGLPARPSPRARSRAMGARGAMRGTRHAVRRTPRAGRMSTRGGRAPRISRTRGGCSQGSRDLRPGTARGPPPPPPPQRGARRCGGSRRRRWVRVRLRRGCLPLRRTRPTPSRRGPRCQSEGGRRPRRGRTPPSPPPRGSLRGRRNRGRRTSRGGVRGCGRTARAPCRAPTACATR